MKLKHKIPKYIGSGKSSSKRVYSKKKKKKKPSSETRKMSNKQYNLSSKGTKIKKLIVEGRK